MNKHDNYEDALFNLLMDEISLDQGDGYLSECDKLNALEDFENEEELMKLGEKTISRELGRIQRQKVFAFTRKSLRTLSVAAVITLILCAAAYLTIPKFQSFVNNNLNEFIQPTEVTGKVDSDFAIAGTGSTTPPENYVEQNRSYDYTEDGIIETVTYKDPESSKTYTVKTFREYPQESEEPWPYDSIVIPPPTPYRLPYNNDSSYYGNYAQPESTPSIATSIDIYPNPKPMIAGAGYGGTIGPKSPFS